MIPSLLQIPSAVSDSKLHSVLPNNGKGDFTFDRSTGATRINKDGLIEEVGYFSSELVQNGNFSELGSELVTNGNFDNWTNNNPDGWTVVNEDANNFVSQQGTYARIVSNDTASIQIKQTIFTIGKTYKVELDAVVNDGNVEGLKLNDATAAATIGYVNSTGHHTFYFVAAGTAFVINRKGGGATDISIDNVSVKQVDTNDRWTLQTGWGYGDGVANCDGSQSGNANIFQPVSFTVGSVYKVSFDVSNYSAGTVKIVFGDTGGSLRSANGNYVELFTFVSGSNFFIQGNSSFVGTIDNISVVEVQGDRPRLSYDITNGVVEDKPHLLLEPSSTNRIKFSEDFSQWNDLSSNNVEYVADLVNPDGSVGGYKVKGDGIFVTDGSGMSGAATSTSGRSIYARSVSGTGNVQLLSHNTNTNNVFTVNETWQRFELNSSPQIGGNFYVDLRGASSTLSEVYVFAAQSESIDIVTSYIKTAGTTITRAAETCNNSKPSVNSTEGVLYAEIAALANDNTYRILSISDGTTNERVYMQYTNASNKVAVVVKDGGVTQANMVYVLSDATNFSKVALKWKANDFALWVDGSQRSTDTSGSVSSAGTLNVINFDAGNGNSDFYGKVKGLAVYNEALTDAQLIELTS